MVFFWNMPEDFWYQNFIILEVRIRDVSLGSTWTRVGEGEGSLPWSSICSSPEERDCVSNNIISAYAEMGEAGRSSCQSTVPGNLHMQVSQRQTATRSIIIIIRPEHPEKHIHGFVVGRMSTVISLPSNMWCITEILLGEFSPVNSLQTWLTEPPLTGWTGNDIWSYWRRPLRQEQEEKSNSTSPIWWLQNAVMACTSKTHGREQPGLMALILAVATCLRKRVQSCWYDTRV